MSSPCQLFILYRLYISIVMYRLSAVNDVSVHGRRSFRRVLSVHKGEL